MKEKTLLVRIPTELHKSIKIYCSEHEITMQKCVMKGLEHMGLKTLIEDRSNAQEKALR